MKVISGLQGGLGNQLFQFAVARAISLRLNARMLLDDSALKLDHKRSFELGAFKFPSTLRIVSRPEGGRRGVLERWFDRVEILREKHCEFDPEIVSMRPNTSLHLIGYWQTEKYFQAVANQIRSDLQFAFPPDRENQSVLEEIRAVTAVSVHFRRGDFISEAHTAAYNGTPSLDYYRRAVAMITAQHPNAHLFVFSDEPQWVKDNFQSSAPMKIVDINPPDAPAADLRLMAACRHHVMANSTFSWWGAWLNPSSEKMVIGPNPWYQGAKLNTVDFLPAGWLTIAKV